MTDASPSPLPRGWLVVGLLWVVGALNYLDRGMLTTMHGSIVAAIPMSETQFGLLTSIFLWVYGVLSPFAGFIADRFSRRRVIILSVLVWSAVTLLTGYARTFEQLLCMRALMGISEACYIPAGLALIADYHRGSTRSLATGIHMTGIGVGAGLGGIGGLLAESHSWSYPFSLFGIAGLAYAGVLLLLLKDVPKEGVHAGTPKVRLGEALTSLFANRGFILTFSYFGLLGLAANLVAGWLPTYFSEHFHLAQGRAGFLSVGVSRAANFCGYIAGGILGDWASRRHLRGRILVAGIGLLLAAPSGLLVATSGILGFALIGVIFGGFFGAFNDPNMMPILCLVADPRYRATGYGILNLFACFVGGVGIYAGGALRDMHIGLNRILLVPMFTTSAAAVLLLLIRPKVGRGIPAGPGSDQK